MTAEHASISAPTSWIDLDIDVTEAAGLSEQAFVAVSVQLPSSDAMSDLPVVCFAKPGAGFTRHYFTDDLPGPGSGAQAAWHAMRGWIFVSVDYLGVGASSRHEPEALDFRTLASAADAADRRVLEMLAAGTLSDRIQALSDPVVIGLGQSMGGCLLVLQQAWHRTYDGIGVLGYSAMSHPPTGSSWSSGNDLAVAAAGRAV